MAKRRTQYAKTHKRKNAKTQKRKYANQNAKRRHNGGYDVEDKDNYKIYTFTKEEITEANKKSNDLIQEYRKNNKMPNPKTDRHAYNEWYSNQPNLRAVVKELYPEIAEQGKDQVDYAIQGLQEGIKQYIGRMQVR